MIATNPNFVKINEVAPRDGLQSVKNRDGAKVALPIQTRAAFIRRLHTAGLNSIEIGSFVRPDIVPQMASTDKVAKQLKVQDGRRKVFPKGTEYSVITADKAGLVGDVGFKGREVGALATGVPKVAVFTSASDLYETQNVVRTTQDSLKRLDPIIKTAKAAGKQVRAYVSMSLETQYERDIRGKTEDKRAKDRALIEKAIAEGANIIKVETNDGTERYKEIIDYGRLLKTIDTLLRAGADEIVFCDTNGTSTASIACDVLEPIIKGETLLGDQLPADKISLHLHDNSEDEGQDRILKIVDMALGLGIRSFDSSAGNLGGSSSLKDPHNNISTRKLALHLHSKGYETGVDVKEDGKDGLSKAEKFIWDRLETLGVDVNRN